LLLASLRPPLVLPCFPTRRSSDLDAILDGSTLYLSGKGPRRPDGSLRLGKVGRDVTVEEAREDAGIVGINLLAAIRDAVGSLERSEEHTSELQSRENLVCRLLLEK